MSLSDSKSPWVSKTLRVLADLNNAVVWIVSLCSLISKSSCLFIKSLETVMGAPITIGITVTIVSHSFFSSLARSKYLSLFWLSFSFTLWLATEFTIWRVLFFVNFFHTSFNGWFFAEVLITANLLVSPGIFYVFLSNWNSGQIRKVLILPLISCSLSLIPWPLDTVPRAPTTSGITITFTFQSFFFPSSLARFQYLSIFSFSFIFFLSSAGMSKSTSSFLLV